MHYSFKTLLKALWLLPLISDQALSILIEGQPVLLGGDVLVEMGGQAFYRTPENVARLQKYLTAVAVGEELELTVFRDGKRKRLVANKPDSN